MVEFDDRKLRLYQYMLDNGKVELNKIPDPYKNLMTIPSAQ